MQAARGTSLSEVARRPRATRSRVSLGLFALAALVLYAADQVTKAVVVAHLTQGEPRHLVGSLLELSLVRNPGAAFSTGTSYTVVLSIVAILAVLVVLVLAARTSSAVWSVALGVLLAGIAGNLTDRLLRDPSPLHGHVVDFLRLPHWPVFNVADICINVAALMILIQAFRGVRLDGTRVAGDSDSDTDTDGDSDSDTRTDTHGGPTHDVADSRPRHRDAGA